MNNIKIYGNSDGAKYLGVSVSSMKKWVMEGKIHPLLTESHLCIYTQPMLDEIKRQRQKEKGKATK